MKAWVSVRRGRVEESRHTVHAVAVDARGMTVASAGDSERVVYLRSTAKPFQALPLVEEGVVDRLDISTRELAVCCASHTGEPEHLEQVRSLLDRAGLTVDDLRCGAVAPLDAGVGKALLRRGGDYSPIHNNCSGKHAGMLALAVGMGWPPTAYPEADHPVQRRMAREIARWSALDVGRIDEGTDGCGVVTFAVPLCGMAVAFARFGRAAHAGDPGPSAVVDAMTRHPFLVAGTGRLDTELMEVTEGRVVAKSGAEGIVGVAVPGEGLGIALKVEDGDRRAVRPSLVHLLRRLDLLGREEVEALLAPSRVQVTNTLGDVVGRLEVELDSSPP